MMTIKRFMKLFELNFSTSALILMRWLCQISKLRHFFSTTVAATLGIFGWMNLTEIKIGSK